MKLGHEAKTPAQWGVFTKKYRSEMATPENRHAIELLAVLSRENSGVGPGQAVVALVDDWQNVGILALEAPFSAGKRWLKEIRHGQSTSPNLAPEPSTAVSAEICSRSAGLDGLAF
jgi:hypothetical protein